MAAEDLLYIYRQILTPSIPPDELESYASLASAYERGTLLATVAKVHGRPSGVAMFERTPGNPVAHLAYLAVDPNLRGVGLGGKLLDQSITYLGAAFGPSIVLTGVQDRDLPMRNQGWGDPARRRAFYRRHGGRELDAPYFQPALDEDHHRVPMRLLCLYADDSFTRDGRLVAEPVSAWWDTYVQAHEGAPHDDDAAALRTALNDPDGIAFLDGKHEAGAANA